MKGILNEIKQQPEHIRGIFMWLCVVITFSLVGFVWFRMTAKQFVALVNPQKAAEERMLAEKEKNLNAEKPFATIWSSLKNATANIGDLFNLAKGSAKFDINNSASNNTDIRPLKLPLAGDKDK